MNKLLVSTLALLILAAPAAAQPGQLGVGVAGTVDRPAIDVETYTVEVTLIPGERRIEAVADILFRQLDRGTYATFDLDTRLRISRVSIGDEDVRYRQYNDGTFEVDLTGRQFEDAIGLHVEYNGSLAPAAGNREPLFASVSENSAFFLYDGKWYPTNGLYRDPAHMNLRIDMPEGWTVVSDLDAADQGFVSSTPAYWGMVVAGNYAPGTLWGRDGEIVVHAFRQNFTADIAGAAVGMLDFYRGIFGPAPASRLRIIEVPDVNWDVQWAFGTLLLSSSQFREDVDEGTLARAIAHQWFPLKVAVADPASDAWLVDGMAVFASMLYWEETLPPAEAQDHIDRVLVKALGYEGNSSTRLAGRIDRNSIEYRALVENKGAYVLRMLRWLMGEDKFHELLVQYVERYQGAPASTEAFIVLASEIAGEDLEYFFDQWLNYSAVPEFSQDWRILRVADGFMVQGKVTQDVDLFRMPVEIRIDTDAEPEYQSIVVSGESTDFELHTERRPRQIVIDPYKKILRMSPDIRVAVLINRGEEFANLGRINDAINDYQAALEINPRSSLANFRMGEATFELGNTPTAAEMFRRALNGDLSPRWVEVWAYINLGKIFDFRGERERAVNEYQKAINTGDNAYGAQEEARGYLERPFRRPGTAIGDAR